MNEPHGMKEAHFEFALRRDGFAVERKVVPAQTRVSDHAHPFDVRALVLNGEITLTVEEIEHTYREGDIFVVPAGHRHAEAVGPEGVEYVVGRRAVEAGTSTERAGVSEASSTPLAPAQRPPDIDRARA
jgi:quercetin dioxygenase-like cupin family protein